MKKPGLALIIAEKVAGKGKGAPAYGGDEDDGDDLEKGDPDEAYVSCAEDILAAVAKKDAGALATALAALKDI